MTKIINSKKTGLTKKLIPKLLFSLMVISLFFNYLPQRFIFAENIPAVSGVSQEASDLTASEKPLTLSDCYALALKQSETIAIKAEIIKEAEAHFVQALEIGRAHV